MARWIGAVALTLGLAGGAWLALSPAGAAPLTGVIDGPDAQRAAHPVVLAPVTDGLVQITDIQALPGAPHTLVVLTKQGVAWRVDGQTGRKARLFDVPVLTRSEQGLLGLAFHPGYASNRRFFLNYSARTDAGRITRIAEWRGDLAGDAAPAEHAVLLEVPQPWPNHNAGQLAFGPDGHLYVGLGDGGAANDPHGNGQNLKTLLGAMLRLDVDHPAPGRAYGIPKDNPFVGRADARPEIWAYGLRNPWRYAFAPDGRLVVGDVGQNLWEEITVVGRGENHGWNTREADHCFPPGATCARGGLIDPIHTYPHGPLGSSVTGGVVVPPTAGLGALGGRYLFGDFASGRLWALALPPAGQAGVKAAEPLALGRFAVQPATFGLDGQGAVYVGDFGAGVLYRVRPAR